MERRIQRSKVPFSYNFLCSWGYNLQYDWSVNLCMCFGSGSNFYIMFPLIEYDYICRYQELVLAFLKWNILCFCSVLWTNLIKALSFLVLILECFITASKVLSLPGSFGKKKSESHPPSPPNPRPYQNGTANSPRVHQPRPSSVAVKKTTVPESNRSFPPSSSDEISVNLNGQHDFYNHKPEKPLKTVPLSPNNMVLFFYFCYLIGQILQVESVILTCSVLF